VEEETGKKLQIRKKLQKHIMFLNATAKYRLKNYALV
jgi:hypothetical protein